MEKFIITKIYHKKNFKNKKFLNDTELLANLFEIKTSTSIPRKLDGMFAYALYDKKKINCNFQPMFRVRENYFIMIVMIFLLRHQILPQFLNIQMILIISNLKNILKQGIFYFWIIQFIKI